MAFGVRVTKGEMLGDLGAKQIMEGISKQAKLNTIDNFQVNGHSK